MKSCGWILVHALFLTGAIGAGESLDAFRDRVHKFQAQYGKNVRIASQYPFREFETAAKTGDLATVKRLLDQGVPADLPLPWPEESFEGIPPTERALHHAASAGHLEIVRLLLDRGADPNGRAGEGEYTPLHAAHDVKIAKLLVSHGANVNARDGFGAQPIHHAADNPAMARFLIAHGANPLAKDREEEQPIHAAARFGNAQDVAFFLGLNAKVDAKVHDNDGYDSFNGRQPLHFAASREDMEEALDVAELLIRKGADVNAVTSEGETPLHLSKSASMTRFLLDHGAKMNVMNTSVSGMLPIHLFALHGDAESIRLLLDRGADPNALTGGPVPETPLDIAVFFNRRNDAAKLLLKRGAKPTQQTLAAAGRSKNRKMIHLIRARLNARPKRPPHRR